MPFWERKAKSGEFSNLAKVKAQEQRDAVYDKEYIKHKKQGYAKEAKEKLRREDLGMKGRAREDLKPLVKGKDTFYKNLGGKISVNKDALSKLKRIGKKY